MQTPHTTPRSGTIAGVIAMLGVLLILRILTPLTGVKPLVETLADGILLVVPVDVFSWLKTTLGDQAKTWLYIGTMLGFIALGALLGRWVSKGGEHWYARMYQAATGLFVLAVTLLFLVDRDRLQEFFLLTVIGLAIASFVYALILHALLKAPTGLDIASPSRRRAIGTIIAGAGAIVIGRDIWQLWSKQPATTTVSADDSVTSAITPVGEFYRISKNFVDPENDRGADWAINVAGLVDHPGDWTYQQFADLGFDHSISTMLCISNEVGGRLIGTADWSGIPLATALEAMGASGGYVTFHGADDYETTVPMDRCRHEQAFLVWGMNGEPLPREHGAPVRAIIPGLYGMKSVKWLTGIEVSNEDRLGFWEERNWTNIALVKPMSRIDYPNRTHTLAEGSVPIRGVAFGGDFGVKSVEVSTDGGDTWNEARITEQPNPDGIAWSLWQYDWPATAGTHDLVVRMIGLDDSLQTEESASPLPDGSSGWHRVQVFVNRA